MALKRFVTEENSVLTGNPTVNGNPIPNYALETISSPSMRNNWELRSGIYHKSVKIQDSTFLTFQLLITADCVKNNGVAAITLSNPVSYDSEFFGTIGTDGHNVVVNFKAYRNGEVKIWAGQKLNDPGLIGKWITVCCSI